MPNFFPCPNPACTYQFDADQLPAAAMVTCPICRTKFPYRAAAPAPADAAPVDSDSLPPEPDDNPFGSSAPVERSTRPNRLVTPRNVPKSSRSSTLLMAVGAAIVVAVLLFCIIYTLRRSDDRKQEEMMTYENGNFLFRKFDPDVWKKDNTLINSMNVNGFVYRRNDPDGWIVVHFRDFKTKNPRPDEMRNELFNMLRASMKNVQKEPLDKVTIGETPAEGVQFTARYGDADLYGQGFAFHRRGFGYVLMFFSTATGWEQAQKELDQYRNSFAFGDKRKDWRESEPDSAPLFEKDMRYQLSDVDAVWKKARILGENEQAKRGEYVMGLEQLKGHDENAKLFAKMKAPVKNVKLERDAPEAFVMLLEINKPAGDPLEAASKYLHDKLGKDQGSDRGVKITFDPAPKTISGAPIPKSVGIFNTTNSEDRSAKRFYAVSTLPLGDKLVVAVAWCKEIDAEIFEPFMLNLVGSLQERQ